MVCFRTFTASLEKYSWYLDSLVGGTFWVSISDQEFRCLIRFSIQKTDINDPTILGESTASVSLDRLLKIVPYD